MARIDRAIAEALRRKVARSKCGLGEAVEMAVSAWLGINGHGV